jgi:hypothetical protein
MKGIGTVKDQGKNAKHQLFKMPTGSCHSLLRRGLYPMGICAIIAFAFIN